MPFEKGNQAAKGRRSAKEFTDMLRLAIKEAHESDGSNKMRAVADALVDKAMTGDVQAIREVADRLEGKVAQQVELGGKDGGPIEFKTVYEAPKD